jgi:hypothetical protein
VPRPFDRRLDELSDFVRTGAGHSADPLDQNRFDFDVNLRRHVDGRPVGR